MVGSTMLLSVNMPHSGHDEVDYLGGLGGGEGYFDRRQESGRR